MESTLKPMSNSAEVCRSCLASDQNLLRMDSTIGDVLKISDCLNIYLNVEVLDDDNLPYTICLRCLDELLLIRKFHLRYFESVNYLLDCGVKSKQLKSANEEDCVVERPAAESVLKTRTINEINTTEYSGIDLTPPASSMVKIEEVLKDEWLDSSEEGTEEKSCKEEFIEFNIESVDDSAYTGESDSQQHETDDSQPQQASITTRQKRTICCLQCHRGFTTRNDLRTHFHTVHGEDNARGFCTQCTLMFPTRGELISHLYTHRHPSSSSQCEFCGRSFTARHKLISHLRTHTGERPYSCPICGRAFSQKTVMMTHMTLHTGKQVPCPKCDKKFSRNSFLNVHMRVHNDTRPYACHLCDKKYRMSSHLKSHILTHSDIRNFSCEICGQSFRERNAVRNHMKIHTRPFKCPVCNLRSAQPHSFRIHLAKMHNIHEDVKRFLIAEEK